MDIRDFVSRLRVESGPKSNGEYLCRCPAHDDKTASLCVRDGDKGIVVKCQAGCDTKDVLAAMGLKMSDLFHDAGTGKAPYTRNAKAPTPKATAKKPAKQFPSYEAAYGFLGKFVCAYVYRDESGKPLFEVARIDTSKGGKRDKTFRQHRLVGENWTFPLEAGVPDELKDTLYHLPEVKSAIKAGATVYVVEGEKDADNMAALGYTATTNVMGAGKWRDAYTAALAGADVALVPDNDKPGRVHAELVSRSMCGKVKSVRVIDLKAECPELPDKGDVTDFFKLLGREKGMAALDKLVKNAKPLEGNPTARRDEAAEYYKRLDGYRVHGGRICQETQDGPKPLANFVAMPTAVISRDDGVNITKDMVIEGWSADGKALPKAVIKASQFAAMNWVAEHWDFAASIMPGSTVKDKVRYTIQEVGNMTAKRLTEYTHTGWRQIGGKWAYLYQGGAIGAEGVTVDLGSGLSSYRLDGSGAEGYDAISYRDGALATMNIKNCMAKHVAIPLLGTVFLAPLREFLAATGVAPAYALFMLGGTGTRKSTALALALSHYGNFTSKSLPASFNDTANFIRKKAFLLKDAVIAVDDYHPVTSLVERKKMEATAQSLARAFGDGAERGRMKSDLSLQEAMPPRGVAIISGEDTPGVGESGMARFFISTIGKDDIPATDELTLMQEMAREGYLQKSMRGYVKWLLQQADDLPNMLHETFIKNRSAALERTKGQHGRTAEAIAHMMLGYQSMLRYMRDVGAITTDEAVQELEAAWNVVTSASKRQSEEMREERPSKMFLSAISELLLNKSVGVRDLTANPGEGSGIGSREMIGYMDASYYYLMPNVAYRAVAKLCNDQGQSFPLTAKMLYKQMREDGVLTEDNTTATSATRPKRIDGKTQRLLWIPRGRMDGPEVEAEQQRLDFNADIGHDEDGDDMPF